MTIALAALIALAAAAPAEKSEYSAAETRRMIDEYGACIVKKQAARASQAILENVDNSLLLRKYRRLIDGTCLPLPKGATLEARFAGDQYRYALADALVRRELAAAPAPTLDAIARLDHRDPGEPPSRVDAKGRPLKEKANQEALEGYQRARAFTYLSRYGECVVRVDPAAARALLLTKPESAEESAQFAAMQTALGSCLPEGETLKLGKLSLRGTIAINYYRLAHAARGAVPERG